MDIRPLFRKLSKRWPGVDPYQAISVLRDAAEQDHAAIEALLQEVLALPPEAAATRLMVPVAAAIHGRKVWEEPEVLSGLSALVRAGGDPTAVLPLAAEKLSHWKTRGAAAGLLRGAALRGWSLVDLALPTGESRPVERLAALQRRGRSDLVAALGVVYRSQRIGNLQDSIGLVEEQLLSESAEAAAEAERVLSALEEAGSDLYAAWLGLQPLLLRQLRGGAFRREAARGLRQVDLTRRYAAGRTPAQVKRSLAPQLTEATLALSEALGADHLLAGDAARALQTFAEFGASMAPARAALEQASGSPHAEVRSASARALTAWLVQSGQEKKLPRNRSRRRVFGESDEPLPGQRPQRCPHCSADGAVVIYTHEDISQTHADITVELFCETCRIYSEEHYGY